MFCKNCGQKLEDEMKVCYECGTPVAVNTIRKETGTKATWLPATAGILAIIAGGLELFPGILIAMAGSSIIDQYIRLPMVGILGIPLIVMGIVAVIGGVCSLKRKTWGLALAGAICSLFIPVLGVLSIIFVAIGKNEFK